MVTCAIELRMDTAEVDEALALLQRLPDDVRNPLAQRILDFLFCGIEICESEDAPAAGAGDHSVRYLLSARVLWLEEARALTVRATDGCGSEVNRVHG